MCFCRFSAQLPVLKANSLSPSHRPFCTGGLSPNSREAMASIPMVTVLLINKRLGPAFGPSWALCSSGCHTPQPSAVEALCTSELTNSQSSFCHTGTVYVCVDMCGPACVREKCRCVPGSQESHGLCNIREQCELLDCDLIITVLYLCVFRLYRKAGVLRQENKVFHKKLF